MRTALTPLPVRPVQARSHALVAALLLLVAGLLAGSQALLWHRDDLADEPTRLLDGYQIASWLVAASLLLLVLAFRFWRAGFGFYGRLLLLLLTGAAGMGFFADYIDANTRAAALYLPPYNGPGFFMAGAALSLLGVVNVISWLQRD